MLRNECGFITVRYSGAKIEARIYKKYSGNLGKTLHLKIIVDIDIGVLFGVDILCVTEGDTPMKG